MKVVTTILFWSLYCSSFDFVINNFIINLIVVCYYWLFTMSH